MAGRFLPAKTCHTKMIDRIPPNSTDVEEQVLSAIFIEGPGMLVRALDAKICEQSFHDPENQLVWRTLIWAHRRGVPLEVATIAQELQQLNKLERMGGYKRLMQVSGKLITTATAGWAMEKLQELFMLRELINRTARIQDEAYNYSGDIAKFTTEIEDALRLREGLTKTKTLQEACIDTTALLKRFTDGNNVANELDYCWPWNDANQFLLPILGGELVIIAARPGRGKSSIARQLAWHWSQTYGEIQFFSREMPIMQLPQLFAQHLCGVSWKDARLRNLTPEKVEKLQSAIVEVQQNGELFINDSDKTISQIQARIKARVQIKKPKAVFIDYLQAYDCEQQRGETRDMAIGRFTRAMKDIALDLDIPVILLAQISRSVEREEREPRDSDLRESGNIEQDADRIIFVHWTPEDRSGIAQDFNDQNKSVVAAKLMQTKSRNSGQAFMHIDFRRPTTSFFSPQP